MRSYGNNVRYGLAVHIYSSIGRIRRGQKIVNPQLNSIRKTLPQEFSVALESLKIIREQISVEIPIDEAGFLAVFFDLSRFQRSERVQVIVIAHGTSTAVSLAEAANRLLGMNYAAGINASLDESPQKVYLRLKDYLADHSPTSGLLLLVDMGSLLNFPSDLEKELGIQAKAIPLVSTLHVMEAVRKAALGYPLEYVYQETLRVDELLYESKSLAPIKEQLARMFIVAVCTTGEGSAVLIKNILDSQLNYCNALCETIPLKLTGCDDIKKRLNAIRQIGRILCVISTFHIDFPVPHFNLADILEGHAIPEIQSLIDQEAVFEKIGQTFSTMLENGDNRKILDHVREAVTDIEWRSGLKLKSDVLIGVFCHMGCMIDRLLGKRSVTEFPRKETFIKENLTLFSMIKTACEPLQNTFCVSIPDDEICCIATFFAPENCKINSSDK
jgi:transcriptional regulatory protein LevR